MKILHTSDWHIGRTLCGRKRYDEHESFLFWLSETIQKNEIDVLLVAGDVFDTTAPSNRAQELYYRFLCRVAASNCRHVVIIAGNHDSPSFLNAPKELLRALHVHVIGNCSDSVADEVLVLKSRLEKPELIVCAVPYLRDKDIRTSEPGETMADKDRKMAEGIQAHYAAAAAVAMQKRMEVGLEIPIVAMGHLFTVGGQTQSGDGVRELYVGSLAQVTAEIFPNCFDYVALGHLHVPQKVAGSEMIRYSGSPLNMGFGESKQTKSLCEIQFSEGKGSVHLIPVPVFKTLDRIQGDWSHIEHRIQQLAAMEQSIWVEIVYNGSEIMGDLQERLEQAVVNTKVEILRAQDTRLGDKVLNQACAQETLDDLDENEVFKRCLKVNAVAEDQWDELMQTYREAILAYSQADIKAE